MTLWCGKSSGDSIIASFKPSWQVFSGHWRQFENLSRGQDRQVHIARAASVRGWVTHGPIQCSGAAQARLLWNELSRHTHLT